MSRPDRPLPDGRVAIWRHPLPVRITHWMNALCILFLVMTGLNILEAHPHLYWGLKSTFDDAWISFGDIPGWLTFPSSRNLYVAREWHFFFAWIFVINGVIYLAYALISGRFKRLMEPSREELIHIPDSIVEHAKLHFPEGEEARTYNVIQKLTYLIVLLFLLPMMLATGLSMSPTFNAVLPELLQLFGGRQSARTLHFLSGSGIVLFAFVHVVLVFLSGPVNNLRAMTTGWFAIRPDAPPVDARPETVPAAPLTEEPADAS